MSPNKRNLFTIRIIQFCVIFLIAVLILYQFNPGTNLTRLDLVIITVLALILTFISYRYTFGDNQARNIDVLNVTGS